MTGKMVVESVYVRVNDVDRWWKLFDVAASTEKLAVDSTESNDTKRFADVIVSFLTPSPC